MPPQRWECQRSHCRTVPRTGEHLIYKYSISPDERHGKSLDAGCTESVILERRFFGWDDDGDLNECPSFTCLRGLPIMIPVYWYTLPLPPPKARIKNLRMIKNAFPRLAVILYSKFLCTHSAMSPIILPYPKYFLHQFSSLFLQSPTVCALNLGHNSVPYNCTASNPLRFSFPIYINLISLM